jgi:hypothetical protein
LFTYGVIQGGKPSWGSFTTHEWFSSKEEKHIFLILTK